MFTHLRWIAVVLVTLVVAAWGDATDDSWQEQFSLVDRKGNFVYTWLYHFSNYAVEW